MQLDPNLDDGLREVDHSKNHRVVLDTKGLAGGGFFLTG